MMAPGQLQELRHHEKVTSAHLQTVGWSILAQFLGIGKQEFTKSST